MAYEVLRDIPLHDEQIETPLETMTAKVIDGKWHFVTTTKTIRPDATGEIVLRISQWMPFDK